MELHLHSPIHLHSVYSDNFTFISLEVSCSQTLGNILNLSGEFVSEISEIWLIEENIPLKLISLSITSLIAAGIAQSVHQLATGWMVQSSNPGGREIIGQAS